LICSLIGCSPIIMGSRFYSGDPLPRNEVFLVIDAQVYCELVSIRSTKEQDVKRLARGGWVLELLPGQYDLRINYEPPGCKESLINITLNGKRGHVYIIYPHITESTGHQFWQPVVIDVASDEDFSRVQCESCVPADKLRKMVNEYFQGSLSRHKGRPIKVYECGFHFSWNGCAWN